MLSGKESSPSVLGYNDPIGRPSEVRTLNLPPHCGLQWGLMIEFVFLIIKNITHLSLMGVEVKYGKRTLHPHR